MADLGEAYLSCEGALCIWFDEVAPWKYGYFVKSTKPMEEMHELLSMTMAQLGIEYRVIAKKVTETYGVLKIDIT